MSPFLELARRRRTAHKYLPEPVAHEVVLEALESALLAPNHKHTFPWHFLVVGNETRRKLAERVFAIKKSQNPEFGEEQRQSGLESFLTPPVLVVFAQTRSETEFQRREDYATVSCAIHNFTLALAERGLGSKWSTAGYITDAEVYKILGLSEVEFEIAGFVWGGTPATEPSPQRRPYLSQVLKVLP